jgi:hypothetical protein
MAGSEQQAPRRAAGPARPPDPTGSESEPGHWIQCSRSERGRAGPGPRLRVRQRPARQANRPHPPRARPHAQGPRQGRQPRREQGVSGGGAGGSAEGGEDGGGGDVAAGVGEHVGAEVGEEEEEAGARGERAGPVELGVQLGGDLEGWKSGGGWSGWLYTLVARGGAGGGVLE